MSYYPWDKQINLEALKGKTIDRIEGLEKGSEEVRIFTQDGGEYLFYHSQDCCESVDLYDLEADCEDWSGALILDAFESSNSDEGEKPGEYAESWTWTFYKIETSKGGIWMRWLGESNGYYSESVEIAWVNKPEQTQ